MAAPDEAEGAAQLAGSRRAFIEVTLDDASIGRNNAEVEHEREVAIFDLLERNRFALGEPRRPGVYAAALARRQPPRLHRRLTRRANRSST